MKYSYPWERAMFENMPVGQLLDTLVKKQALIRELSHALHDYDNHYHNSSEHGQAPPKGLNVTHKNAVDMAHGVDQIRRRRAQNNRDRAVRWIENNVACSLVWQYSDEDGPLATVQNGYVCGETDKTSMTTGVRKVAKVKVMASHCWHAWYLDADTDKLEPLVEPHRLGQPAAPMNFPTFEGARKAAEEAWKKQRGWLAARHAWDELLHAPPPPRGGPDYRTGRGCPFFWLGADAERS
jgi:hypothetical protein